MSAVTIDIPSHDGKTFTGYLAVPESGSGPGLVLIQEIFGVNQVMRDLADWYASQGFVTACPDIFWRQEPGIELTDQTQEEWDKAFELMQGFDLDLGIEDLTSTAKFLRGDDRAGDTVGTVGYCLGGRLAFMMACRSDIDAAVSYYGVNLQEHLDEAAKIEAPTLLHIADEDQFVPDEAKEAVISALQGHPQITMHVYKGMDHAFAREGGEHYDKENADLANTRTIEHFNSALKSEHP